MRFIIFATIFLTVFALLNLYIVKRFINKLHIKNRYKKYFKLFLVFNFLGIIGYMFARYNPAMPNWLFFLLSLPIGVVFLIFCTAVIYDISHLLVNKIPLSQKRREFFKKGLDYSSLAIAGGLSTRAMYEAKFIELEKVDIKIKDLKKEYTIVQLSDIHIGGLIDQKFIRDMVKKVNTLKPDIVVITGDMVDIALNYALPALNELKNLDTKYGTYFIVGNHEYFHGIESIISTVNSLGIKTLENENIYIGEANQGFNLAGVYDVFGYRANHHKPDLEKALKNKNANSPTILLAHQPRYIEEVKSGVDLMLSGHTHGGQLYPFRALVKILQPYLAGLYTHNENLQIYVNKGTGFWGPPMRLGASSEITKINLS
jgi:predicted MPP superfamily phosphohydrolase